MSSLWPSSVRGHPGHVAGGAASEGSLAILVYRSRSALPMSDAELDRLLQTAQERNRWESVTGVLLYDQGRFFQWLEGPPAGLARIWHSISGDGRHTEIEVVWHQPAQQRCFADWDMKLARRKPSIAMAPEEPIEVSGDLIDALYRNPHEAPGLLASLASRGATRPDLFSPVQASRREIVLDLVGAVALPHLLAEGAFSQPAALQPHGRVPELAVLLTAADSSAAFELIELLQARSGSLATLFATVFEPAARGLGDRWSADDCTEDELTIGLIRLQTAARRLGGCVPELLPVHMPVRAVLVATQPGELHRLGAMLDAELLWQAGWDTRCEYPRDDEALQELVSDTWFDALDLSLSTALRREHWLPRMAETIRRVRSASLNPGLVVVVGGRVFLEQGDASLRIGADVSCVASTQIGSLLLGVLPLGHPPD